MVEMKRKIEDGDGGGDRRRVYRRCECNKRAKDVKLRSGNKDRKKCLPNTIYTYYV